MLSTLLMENLGWCDGQTVILMEIFPFPGMSLLTGMLKVAFALAASCNSKNPRCLWLEATYFG